MTHALDAGRAEALGDERRILGPLDDVDLLAAQLADDRCTRVPRMPTRRRPDRRRARARHRDLRAVAGLAHRAAGSSRCRRNLGTSCSKSVETAPDPCARSPAGPWRSCVTALITAHAVADRVSRHATVPCAGSALDAPISAMMSPLSKRLTVAFTTSPTLAELAVDLLALRFTHALRDDLLGGLRGDAAELLVSFGNSISIPASASSP